MPEVVLTKLSTVFSSGLPASAFLHPAGLLSGPWLRTPTVCTKNRPPLVNPHASWPRRAFPVASHTVIHHFCAKAHVPAPPVRLQPQAVDRSSAMHLCPCRPSTKKKANPKREAQTPIIKGSLPDAPQLPTELSTVFVGKFCLFSGQNQGFTPPRQGTSPASGRPSVCRDRPHDQKTGNTGSSRIHTGSTGLAPPGHTTLSTVFVSKITAPTALPRVRRRSRCSTRTAANRQACPQSCQHPATACVADAADRPSSTVCPENRQTASKAHQQPLGTACPSTSHTVVHRFCAQAHMQAPLTPVPSGSQERSHLSPETSCCHQRLASSASRPEQDQAEAGPDRNRIRQEREHAGTGPGGDRNQPGSRCRQARMLTTPRPSSRGARRPTANHPDSPDSSPCFRACRVGECFLTLKHGVQALMHITVPVLPQAPRFVQIETPSS